MAWFRVYGLSFSFRVWGLGFWGVRDDSGITVVLCLAAQWIGEFPARFVVLTCSQGPGCWVQGSGCRDWAVRFRVEEFAV